jgi:hypothetical protein
MFHGYFKPDLWKMFAELSYFYKQICAKQVSKVIMQRLLKEIAVLICKMETDAIFASAFTLGSWGWRTCAVQVDV